MIRVFKTDEEYQTFTNNGATMQSGDIYYITDDKTLHFTTNNIDGTNESYDLMTDVPEGYIIPTGDVSISENGSNIDVAQYATATVAVPQPSGNITISENGENIDIADYATATVAVQGNVGLCTTVDAEEWATVASPTIFNGTKVMKSVTVPSGVTEIGKQAFDASTKLASVTFTAPNTIATINDYAFRGTGLTSFDMPTNVTTLGQGVFQGCSSLTSCSLPSGITSIQHYLFRDCSSLASTITVPSGVTSIGQYAFYNTKIPKITFAGLSLTSIGQYSFQYTRYLEEIEIPPSVTSIAANAFQGSGISSLSFASGSAITSIQSSVFMSCSNLSAVRFANTITSIGDNAFKSCTALGEITAPTSLTTLGGSAFETCTALTKATLPSTMTTINNRAFYGCSSLVTLVIEATTPPTLANLAFVNTNANFAIYVPDASVTAYQGATNWIAWADRIKGMSELPTT